MFTDEEALARLPAAEARARNPNWMRWQDVTFWLAILGLGIVGLAINDSYVRHILILVLIWALVAASWDLVLGYAGIFNYAQLVFFAVGAYASAMFSLYAGVPALVALVLGTAVGAASGLLIAVPCLRLRGEYVALFTFAVHLALPPVIQQGRSIGLGGSQGLLGIPPIHLFGSVLGPMNKIGWFIFALTVVSICLYVIYFKLLRSKLGHAFVALRDADDFAESLGVNERRYKLIAFIISAAFTALAGGMYAHYTTVLTPKILGTEFFLMVMVMLAIGGMGRYPGAILGAFIVVTGNELLRGFDEYRLLILGIAVVVAVLFLRNGMVSFREHLDRAQTRA